MDEGSRQNTISSTVTPYLPQPLLPSLHRAPGLPPQPPSRVSPAAAQHQRHLADRKRRLSSLSGVSPPSARHRRPPGPRPRPASLSALHPSSNDPLSSVTMNPAGHAASSQTPPNVVDLTTDHLPQGQPDNDPSPEYALPKWQPDGDVQTCPVCGVDFTFWNRKHHCRYDYPSPPPDLRQLLSNHGTGNADESFVPAAPPIASPSRASS
jgi:hypothetical protein